MPSYQDQMRQVERRRRMAEMLQMQAMQPQGQPAGRFYAGPSNTTALGGLAAALGSGLMSRRADRDETAARASEQERIAKAMERMTGGGDPGVDGGTTPPDPRMLAAREMLGGLPLETQQQVIGQQALKTMFPPEKKSPFAKVDPKDYTPESIAKFATSGNVAELVPRRKFSVSGGEVYDPEAVLPGQMIGREPKGTTVNVDTRQETEENKAVGKAFGENYVKIQAAGFDASGKIARLDRMESLLEGVETGRLTPVGTEIAGFAKSLGFDIDPNLANKEAAAALSGEMTLQARNPSGGAGMPGAMSDADRQFLARMAPNLSQTPEGRKMLIETNRKLAKRDQEVAEIARRYRQQNGRLDEGFYDVLADFSARNPLFGGASQPAPGTGPDLAPEIRSLVDKYATPQAPR